MSEETEQKASHIYCIAKPCGCVVKVISTRIPEPVLSACLDELRAKGFTVTLRPHEEAWAAFDSTECWHGVLH